MVNLKFYYKEGCWLCASVEEMLNGISERYHLNIDKISIESDEELYETYRFDIPVIEFSDGTTLHGDIRKKTLVKKLENNME